MRPSGGNFRHTRKPRLHRLPHSTARGRFVLNQREHCRHRTRRHGTVSTRPDGAAQPASSRNFRTVVSEQPTSAAASPLDAPRRIAERARRFADALKLGLGISFSTDADDQRELSTRYDGSQSKETSSSREALELFCVVDRFQRIMQLAPDRHVFVHPDR